MHDDKLQKQHILDTFGQIMIIRRQDLGLSTTDIWRGLGHKSSSIINSWHNGTSRISLGNIESVARLMEFDLHRFSGMVFRHFYPEMYGCVEEFYKDVTIDMEKMSRRKIIENLTTD